MNNKITEGDVIVFNDKFYACQIAGAKDAVFNQINLGVNSYCTTSAKCGGLIMPVDISSYKYRIKNEAYKYIDGCNRFNVCTRNPVVGTVNLGRCMINWGRVKNESDKLFNEYLKKLIRGIKVEGKKDLKAIDRVLKMIGES